jgi:hypothetical protein
MELVRKSNLIFKLKFELNFQLRFRFCPYFGSLRKDQPFPQRKRLQSFFIFEIKFYFPICPYFDRLRTDRTSFQEKNLTRFFKFEFELELIHKFICKYKFKFIRTAYF